MTSARTKRRLATFVVGALWLGAVAFAVLALLPLLGRVISNRRALRQEEPVMQQEANVETVPSIGRIRHAQRVKQSLIAEAERCAAFYLQHSEDLNRKLLESWRLDPYRIAENYRKLKNELIDRAGNPNFLELGPYDDWEQKEPWKPAQKDFGPMEKRACIAEVLVDALSAHRGTVIQLMEIGEASPVAGAPPAEQAKWLVVRGRAFPVKVTLLTPFSSLGRLLDSLVRVDATPKQPCIFLRRVAVEPREAGGDSVKVELLFDVFDFRPVEQAGEAP